MKVKVIFVVFIILLSGFTSSVSSKCATSVVCTATGPPTWTYSYDGTGTGKKMLGFDITDGCDITDASAPLPFTSLILDPTSVSFSASSPGQTCGSYPGFTITAPTATNGTVNWADTGSGTSGTCDGPVLCPTPTPTITPTPTVTPTVDTPSSEALCQGMNLISLPFSNTGLDTADLLLADICGGGQADAIWKWVPETFSFLPWTILDSGTGWDTSYGMPFWVNISTPPEGCSWNVKGNMKKTLEFDLILGLNLISLPMYSKSIANASDFLADIPSCTGVWRWHREVDCLISGFDGFFTISDPADDFSLISGHGYWVNVSAAGTWNPPKK